MNNVITTNSPVNLEHSNNKDLIVNLEGLVEAFKLTRETNCKNHTK